jgi:hypothetical protein
MQKIGQLYDVIFRGTEEESMISIWQCVVNI